MRFDLIDLRLFLRILETGSITQGAAQANMSLPSASALARHGRGDRHAFARTWPSRCRIYAHRRHAGSSRTTGVGADGTPARGTEGAFKRARSIHPPLGEYLCNHGTPAARVGSVSAGPSEHTYRFERAPKRGNRQGRSRGRGGNWHRFRRGRSRSTARVSVCHGSPRSCSGGRDDALAIHRRVALQDVLGRKFIGLSPGSPLQEHLCEHAVLAGQPLRFRAQVRTFEAICSMVEGGAGIGIVPATAAQRYRGKNGIRRIALTDRWATRQLMVCVKHPDALSRPAKALLEQLAVEPSAA